ncbi:hypothetical protein GCM10023331_27010 [Algivirga pacifica]|uniref:Glycosyltransferase 2-like domain-containing protein n=2 Tax=Algivirga pacifica TaxID=1162670 RepID=A0ABP9DDD8_9BACT
MDPVVPFEVIVVLDGCVDGSVEYVKSLCKQRPELKYISKHAEGPAKARNVGVSISRGDIIAFTDDDCIVTKDWISNIMKSFEDDSLVGLQGKTSTYKHLCSPLTHQIDNQHGSVDFPTCNVAIRRDAFLNIGGFDESFPYAHNEDADLGWRLEKLGTVKFIPSMEIIHPPRKEKLSKLIRRMKILESEFLLYHKNKQDYKRKRAVNPWVNIYGKMFCKHLPLIFKSRFRFILQPSIFLQGIFINISWWVSLLYLIPTFMEAEKTYRDKYQKKTTQGVSIQKPVLPKEVS